MRQWLWLVFSRVFIVLWPRWNVITWCICPKKKSFTKGRLLASIYSWCLPSAHEILRNTTFLCTLFTGSSVCWCLEASLHWDVHTSEEERDIHQIKHPIQELPCNAHYTAQRDMNHHEWSHLFLCSHLRDSCFAYPWLLRWDLVELGHSQGRCDCSVLEHLSHCCSHSCASISDHTVHLCLFSIFLSDKN